mmetsp:Transcript_42324/g.111975  ORF Transcript_42324/g.111975 Transcript_42324/m.111975 type:complete len:261 (-) Transcript_42324:497-1279(-)
MCSRSSAEGPRGVLAAGPWGGRAAVSARAAFCARRRVHARIDQEPLGQRLLEVRLGGGRLLGVGLAGVERVLGPPVLRRLVGVGVRGPVHRALLPHRRARRRILALSLRPVHGVLLLGVAQEGRQEVLRAEVSRLQPGRRLHVLVVPGDLVVPVVAARLGVLTAVVGVAEVGLEVRLGDLELRLEELLVRVAEVPAHAVQDDHGPVLAVAGVRHCTVPELLDVGVEALDVRRGDPRDLLARVVLEVAAREDAREALHLVL